MTTDSRPSEQITEARAYSQLAWVFGGLSVAVFLARAVFGRVMYGGDEGFNAMTATNMLHHARYWIEPCSTPDGVFADDKLSFAFPPFSFYFLALGQWLSPASSRLVGMDVLQAVLFGVLLLGVFRLVALYEHRAAAFSVALLGASPTLFGLCAVLEAESLIVTFGVWGIYLLVSSRIGENTPRILASGVCIGMGFALKLWLFGPFVLGSAVTLGLKWFENRGARGAVLRAAAVFALGMALPVLCHLAVIAVLHPEDLGYWLGEIYFGVLTGGIAGGKMSGSSVAANWRHPFWYYFVILYREHFFLFPLLTLGLGSLRLNPRSRPVLFATFAVIAGLLPYCVFAVKEPLYILPSIVFLYVLSGVALSALLRSLSASDSKLQTDGIWPRAVPITVAMALGTIAAIGFCYARHLLAKDITTVYFALHTAIMVAAIALAVLAHRRKPEAIVRVVLGVCVVALAGGLVRMAYNPPQDRSIAALIAPGMRHNAPRDLSFVASNFKSYQLFLFRHGIYARELPMDRTPEAVMQSEPWAKVRAFVLDPTDLNTVGPAWRLWLGAHATDRTQELPEGVRRTWHGRVFVLTPGGHAR